MLSTSFSTDGANEATTESPSTTSVQQQRRLKRKMRSLSEKKAILLEVQNAENASAILKKYGTSMQSLKEWRHAGILTMTDEQIAAADLLGRRKKHRRPPPSELVNQVEIALAQYQTTPIVMRRGAAVCEMFDLLADSFPEFLESDPESADIGSERRKEERVRNWLRSYCKRNALHTERGSIIIPR
jgi:hypothetical protein